MDKNEIIRLLKGDMPTRAYNKEVELKMTREDNLHWGQRKLLLTEIEFLTQFYNDYDPNKEKILLYIGSADGFHINYLIKMFPDLTYHLYDKRKTFVKEGPKVKIYQEYFNSKLAKKYVGKNVFVVCDIRNLEVAAIKKKINKGDSRMSELDNLISKDMVMQKEWCDIIRPIRALLKFRLSYDLHISEYYDGEIFIQPWAKNASTETRLVPDLDSWKEYDNNKYEQKMFYFNTNIRRKEYDNINYPCLGKCYDCIAEANIIKEYIKKFETEYNDDGEKLNARICDISQSITIDLLERGVKKPISNKHIRDVQIHDKKINEPIEINI